MRSSYSFLSAVALVTFCTSSALAGWGTKAYYRAVAEARENPNAAIQRFMERPEDDDERRNLFAALMTLNREQKISAEELLPVVNRGLMDVDDQIRGQAVHYLDEVYDGEKLQDFYRLYTLDKSLGARYNAAEQMRDFPSAESVPYLEALLGDESIEVRDKAAGTLCQWRRSRGLPDIEWIFLRALESEDIRRAGVAARVLASVFDRSPRADILNAYLAAELEKSRPNFGADNVRCIIRLLGAIDDPSSRAVLEKAAEHSHRHVAAEAHEALAQVLLDNGN